MSGLISRGMEEMEPPPRLSPSDLIQPTRKGLDPGLPDIAEYSYMHRYGSERRSEHGDRRSRQRPRPGATLSHCRRGAAGRDMARRAVRRSGHLAGCPAWIWRPRIRRPCTRAGSARMGSRPLPRRDYGSLRQLLDLTARHSSTDGHGAGLAGRGGQAAFCWPPGIWMTRSTNCGPAAPK